MKKNLNEKLQAYLAVAGSMAATSAGAQVVYTDVNPDFIVHDSAFYALDLDSNQVVEFEIRQGSYGGWTWGDVYITGAASNAILSSTQGQYAYPFALNPGDTIQPSSPNWVDYAAHSDQYLGSVYGTSYYGNFRGQNDKYMGLRFDINGVTHYGWVRLSMTAAADTVIVKDYAYEQTPNTYIVAGVVAGIPASGSELPVRVHAYESTIFVHTAIPQEGGTITVYDMTGHLVREEAITTGEMRLSLAGQPAGVYVIHVRQGERQLTRKIYLR